MSCIGALFGHLLTFEVSGEVKKLLTMIVFSINYYLSDATQNCCTNFAGVKKIALYYGKITDYVITRIIAFTIPLFNVKVTNYVIIRKLALKHRIVILCLTENDIIFFGEVDSESRTMFSFF